MSVEKQKNRLEILSEEYNVHVKKIGGTAIENLDDVISDLKLNTDFGQQRIAVSAIRSPKEEYERFKYEGVSQSKTGFNTTSHLKYVADTVRSGDVEKAILIVNNSILPFTKNIVGTNVKDEGTRNQILSIVEECWGEYVYFLNRCTDGEVQECGDDWLFVDSDGNSTSFLKMGEDISAEILHTVLSKQGVSSHLLALNNEAESHLKKYDMQGVAKSVKLRMKLANEVEHGLETSMHEGRESDVIITSGYQLGVATQEGYTDTTAAILLRMASREEGQNPVLHRHMDSGFLSSNPKRVPNAQHLDSMSARLLFEMTAENGPKNPVMIPDAAQITNDSQSDCFIYSTKAPDEITHVVYGMECEVGQVRAVDTVPAATIFRVEGDLSIMRPQGIMSAITEVCKKHKLSIVHTGTSALSIAITLEQSLSSDKFNEVVNDINEEMGYPENLIVQSMEKPENQHVLYCKGDNMQQPGIALQVTYALSKMKANIILSTQAGGMNSMVYIIETDDIDAVLREVHRCSVEHGSHDFVREVIVVDEKEWVSATIAEINE